MNKIIIDFDDKMIRTALTEEGKLVEVIVDYDSNKSLVGNVYLGVVKNILPKQFMFIDIGDTKNGFIHLNDYKEKAIFDGKKLKYSIGKEILVQVLKDKTGDKGVFLTTQISLTGRYVVLIKTGTSDRNIAISKKITDAATRERLKNIVENVLPEGYDIIIRTNASNCSVDIIKDETIDLLSQISNIIESAKTRKPPSLISGCESPVIKSIKDLYNNETNKIIINDKHQYDEISKYLQTEEKIILHNDPEPIFDRYFIEKQFEQILNRKVWLKSGGYILFDYTEACCVIDVNSGKFVGAKNHEQSITKINTEAANEITYQIRLRNITGIILIDFIDMKSADNRSLLIDTIAQLLMKDRISTNLLGMTNLGLIEITRKKMREPISKILTEPCGNCNNSGYRPNIKFIAKKIKLELSRITATTNYNHFKITAHQELIHELNSYLKFDVVYIKDNKLSGTYKIEKHVLK